MQLTFLFVGLLAVLCTLGRIVRFDDELRALSGIAATVFWSYWGLHAFAVTTVSNGARVTDSYPGLGYLGIALAAITLLVSLKLFVDMLREGLDQTSDGEAGQRTAAMDGGRNRRLR